MSLDELIARLELASEGSRELDALIWCAVRGHRFHAMHDSYPGGNRFFYYPATDNSHTYGHALVRGEFCTGSLDAAMALVPEGLASAVGTMAFRTGTGRPWASIWGDDGFPRWHGDAATPALALCIAALRARVQP